MRTPVTASRLATEAPGRASRGGRRHLAAGLAWVLIAGGALLLAGSAPAEPSWQAAHPIAQPPALAVAMPAASPEPTPTPRVPRLPVAGVDFAMAVPALGYRAQVQEGVGAEVLDVAPGHYPASGWPGDDRTVAIAAHNTYWIRFDQLKQGDQVVLETRWGTYTYAVTGRRIVAPDDTTVVVRNGSRGLLMTTCWPLWAGAYAKERLVISAEEIGGVA